MDIPSRNMLLAGLNVAVVILYMKCTTVLSGKGTSVGFLLSFFILFVKVVICMISMHMSSPLKTRRICSRFWFNFLFKKRAQLFDIFLFSYFLYRFHHQMQSILHIYFVNRVMKKNKQYCERQAENRIIL